jgi:putative membrane protein
MRFQPARLRLPVMVLSLLLSAASRLHATDDVVALPPPVSPPWHPTGFLQAIVASVVFGLIGIGLAIAGFKLFDLATPFNLEKEMCENKNIAVGILCAAIVLGICHIIAASMS